jgi:hypothetical protein
MSRSLLLLGKQKSLTFLAGGQLTLDPNVHFGFEDLQRHRTVFQHLVVKRPDVEAFAEGFFGPLPHFQDFQLTNFVGKRLRGWLNV